MECGYIEIFAVSVNILETEVLKALRSNADIVEVDKRVLSGLKDLYEKE